jgi:GntP family gluconate:H+ symporter
MSLTATLTSAWSVALPFADAPPKLTDAGNTQLLLAALAGIAAVVLLISWAKFHPFLALIIGAAVMGGVAGVQPADIVTSFTKGLGSTTGSVGLLIALGAMIGKLLQDSGGSETIVDRLIGGVSPRRLPWMMALIAFILGIPLFFEVGVVLLVPVVILVARKLDLSLMKVGIPALAGLSILHGFVPPHPGPLLAIDIVKADLSMVLLYGLVISVPTLIVSGPLLARFVDQWVPVHASGAPGGSDAGPTQTQTQTHSRPQTSASEAPRLTKRPGFVPAVLSITLPVILMLLRAIGIPTNMFTVMFAIGRMPGWIANWKEIHDDPKSRIYRPRQVYVGNTQSEWVPRDARG